MTVFSGLCVGGPLDGKRIDHFDSRYKVPEQTNVTPWVTGADIMQAFDLTYDVFSYRHLEYMDFRFWLPAQVWKERWEHKFWDHPMDYAMHKLIANYRPEGF